MRPALLLAASLLSLAVSAASGQQRPLTDGLTFGLGTIGWHHAMGHRWAVRPELAAVTSTTVEANGSADISNWWSVALTVPWYAAERDGVRPYFAPRVSFATTRLPMVSGVQTWSFGGSFGAHYTATRRFAVFGESGLIYTYGNSTATAGTRSVLGAMYFFGK